MAQTGAIRAGKAFVEVFADDSKLVRGLKSAQTKLKAFGKGVRNMGLAIGAAGTAIAAPMLAAAKSFAESGDKIWDMSRRTGIAVEDLSLLGYAADQTGTSMEGVEKGVRIMQRSISGAADAVEGTTGKLEDLGLVAADLAGKTPIQQFTLIASRLRLISDPTMRAAAAMKVFGRSGVELLPMIDNLESLGKEAREFGLIRTTESARQAHELSEAYGLMGKVIRSAWNAVGSTLAPALQQVVAWVTRAVAGARDWITQNTGLIVSIFKLAVGAVAAGAVLAALGTVIMKLGVALGVTATVLKLVGAVLAAILSPVGLVIAAIGALGGYLAYTSGVGGKAVGWLGERFGELADDARTAFGAISSALAAGDIGLAAKVLWMTLKMEWQKGVNFLTGIWVGFKSKFMAIFDAFVYGGQALWVEFSSFVQSTWAKLVGVLQTVWAKFTAWHARTVETTANWIAKKWVWVEGKMGGRSDQDIAFMQQHIDQQSAQEFTRIDQGERADLAAAEAKKQDALRAIEESRMNRLADIGRSDAENERRRAAEYQKQLGDSESALAQAKKEWQDAISEAKSPRGARGQAAGPEGVRRADDYLREYLENFQSEGLQKTLGVKGSFNASALLGLQGGGPEDRIAKATEQTAANTKKLAEEAARGGLAFG
ncbi:MAG TPA: hypothetical protein PKG77_22315 [Phycisphaerae bacterium]|nr:hypothetical protein [Phycisphaerae bacterium]HQL76411.1 hypothetical protein [Phycisphaerae bacterium]